MATNWGHINCRNRLCYVRIYPFFMFLYVSDKQGEQIETDSKVKLYLQLYYVQSYYEE